MGAAGEHLNSGELDSIAKQILTEPHDYGGHIWAHCPWHVEDTPGGAFYYTPGKDFGYCHSCGTSGDLINIYQSIHGLENSAAFKEFFSKFRPDVLKGSGELSSFKRTPRMPREQSGQEYEPKHYQDPEEIWQEKAKRLIAWGQQHLERNQEIRNWLAARGIDMEMARKFKLGWNPGERGKDIFRERSSWGLQEEYKENGKPKKLWIPQGLIIPYMDNESILRIRVRRFTSQENELRYYMIPGSTPRMMLIERANTETGLPQGAVAVETELDAIMLHRFVGDLVDIIGLGSSSSKPDEAAYQLLQECNCILLALDFDQAGAKAAEWWNNHFPDISSLWPVPYGKDAGDALQKGLDIRQWILSGLPPAWNFGPSFEQVEKSVEKPQELSPNQENGNAVDDLDIPDTIKELYHLLDQYPAAIEVAQNGSVHLRENPVKALEYWELSKRISDLVFGDDYVIDFLHFQAKRLGRIINRNNLLEGVNE